ncbi:MAG: hypothetical protein COA41_10280 [Sphingopyxis sp.]|nr:MAG: hypothetical protein COA41_10280 [Sphingopyxis sp.]
MLDGGDGTDLFALDGESGTSAVFNPSKFPLTGFEQFEKRGEGSWELAGTLADGEMIDGRILDGMLQVSGQYGALDLTVQSGGTLGGNGTVGDVSLSGGTLAPGASIGTLTIDGNLTLNAASVFEVEVDDQGNGDQVIVNGTVTLGAATLDVVESGTFAGSNPFNYIIIDNDAADAVNGRFGTITNQFAFLTQSVNYAGGDGNDVALTLKPNNQPSPTDSCEVDARTLICSGLLPDGVDTGDFGSRTAFNELIVRDVTGPINAANADGVAIDFVNQYVPVTILIDSPGTLITSQGARFPRPPFVLDSAQAIGVRAVSYGNVTIASNADIEIDANTVDFSQVVLVAGMTAQLLHNEGDVRDVAIENSGSITVRNSEGGGNSAKVVAGIIVGLSPTTNAGGDQTRGIGIGNASILNSGTIVMERGPGIRVDNLFGGTLDIVNSGTITMIGNQDDLFSDGIRVDGSDAAQLLTVTNDGLIHLTQGGASSMRGISVAKDIGTPDSNRATVINNGTIEQIVGEFDFATGISLRQNLSAPAGNGITADVDGATFSVINNGTINVAAYGITVESNANRVIENFGDIIVRSRGNFAVGAEFNFSAPAGRDPDPYNPVGNITRFPERTGCKHHCNYERAAHL